MIRASVTVSLVPEARGGPFVFWGDLPAACQQASQLGFHGLEIFAPSGDVLAAAGARVGESGLQLAAAGTGAGWVLHRWTLVDPQEAARQQAIDYCKQMIDAAGLLGAPAIIGSLQGRWDAGQHRDQTLDRLAAALRELAAHAQGYDVPLLYEPLNRYETNLLTTLADTQEFLAQQGLQNVRVLADLFHMNIEEPDLAAALRDHGACVGHVHWADSNRRAAGMGHTNFAPLADALRHVGYSGYISAEVLPYPSPWQAAEATITAYRHWLVEHP